MPRWQPGETVALERNQSNYLGNVLRLAAGETILVFNGRDGEWQATIAGRKRPDSLTIRSRTRPQDRLPDLAYVFAPLKHARLDYMVQKAVEMGASSLQPVLTRFTQVAGSTASGCAPMSIEAAEQCGILSIAEVAEPVPLDRYLGQREAQRLLVFCDEAADCRRSAAGAARRASGSRRDRRPDRPRRRICRGRARAAAAAAANSCGFRSGRGSCGPIPPGSRRWRWCRPRSATGPAPASRRLGSVSSHFGRSLRHLADPCRNPARPC